MIKVDYLIVGGGIAGTTAAETIRSKDQHSSIIIITEEPDRLYSRVSLRRYLRNEITLENLFIRTPESYRQNNIQLLTSLRVVKVDSQNKVVTTNDNQIFNYSKLLIATGGKVNKLSTPGSNLSEVTYFRTLADVRKIKEIIGRSKEAVVLGGGFIGIDYAQSFVVNNLKTTVIIREKSFWEPFVGENSGKLLSKLLAENGVTVIADAQVTEFIGTTKLDSVKTDNGDVIKADIVGVGIGIHLDIDYLKDSGINLNKGVLTNEFLESTVPNVWAAGDVAEFYDVVFKRPHSLGNWSNAASQGRIVGQNMIGQRQTFETTSMYSINIFDSNFSFLGDPIVDQKTEIIERGTLTDKRLGRLLIREDTIVGASLINLPADRNAITKLIKTKTKITSSRTKLADLSFDLSTIV